jgi:triacylglycerol lipase
MSDQEPAPAIDPLTSATLYLCTISYARNIATIPALVRSMPPLAPGGSWACLWGPAQSSDQSNLAFMAGYFQRGALQSIYVTIRGTNIFLGEDIWGILQQIWQDLDATSQVPLPWAPPGSPERIAQGTSDGLTVIQNLTDGTGMNLATYLASLLAANANITTVVTGHSLGGCLASVAAPWIEAIRPASYKGIVQPITFAAPTAGNAAFAGSYSTMFKTARRFQNTLDVVPLAFQNVPGIVDIYSPYGLDAPDLVWGGVFGWYALLLYYNATYQQPGQGTQLLPGTFFQGDPHDWYAQALYQHHPSTYLSLLTGQPVPPAVLAPSATPFGAQARLAKRIGSMDAALKRIATPPATE